MKEFLAKALGSRKFVVVLAGIIVVVANDGFGLGLDKATVLSVLGMISAYVVGQGIADSKS